MPNTMWFHLFNLLHRISHNFFAALGQTGLGWWVQAIILFAVTEVVTYLVVWAVLGKPAMTARFAKNFKIGLYVWIIVLVCVYGPIFGWHVLKTTYNDHRDVVSRWRAVVNEKNNLKSELSERDQYIQRLEAYIQGHKYLKPDSYCYQNTFNPAPPRNVNAMSMSATWIICPKEVKAPYSIELDYDQHPSVISLPPLFPREAVPTGVPLIVTTDTGIKMTVEAPSLPAWSGILFIVYGDHATPPKVVKFSMQRSN